MFNDKKSLTGLFLISSVLLTRTNHFGTSICLPDATLAVLYLGGLLSFDYRWFWASLIAAFGIDFYALGIAVQSDYCLSIGYLGLIPTYGVVWLLGKYSSRYLKPAVQTKQIVTISLITFSISFVMSNAFWYVFSDKVKTLSILQFTQAVAKYFIPYVGFSMFYIVSVGTTFYVLRDYRPNFVGLSNRR